MTSSIIFHDVKKLGEGSNGHVFMCTPKGRKVSKTQHFVVKVIQGPAPDPDRPEVEAIMLNLVACEVDAMKAAFRESPSHVVQLYCAIDPSALDARTLDTLSS